MHLAPADAVTPAELDAVVRAFAIPGRFRTGAPHGSGHINDTFAVVVDEAGGRPVRYLLQRINDRVFKNVPALMENIHRVTTHLGRRMNAARDPDANRRVLTLVPATDGAPCHRDPAGGWWRCYWFIEGASTHDVIERPEQAREAARAFAGFQHLLEDLPGGRLHETLPDFHHTRRRFEALQRAVENDALNRAAVARAEIAFVETRERGVDLLLGLQRSGAIAERVTHNDTKLNNVMIDDVTQAGVCVIDLDTVMPGLALYDFGDMVRSATNAAAEDERDLARVQARLPIFEALVEGYLAEGRHFLNRVEIDHLVAAGSLITLEIGMRFLTDFLEGDVYFKTHRPGHNLDRARNQFALVRSIEAQQDAMNAIVRKHTS